ncbi:YdcF family protein [Candidatus Roizmanbacteria bacterium]|jgi:uncharacterized SAM-binding protein YcdF (DUF218 family)|nr:MAG: YdcF family protein [Candidatus Roizmanbacteria bacterium]
MKRYDGIVILGSQPINPSVSWTFPTHVYNSLDRAIELHHKKVSPYIIVSGKWSVRFDTLKITPPFTECDKMAEYLLEKGVTKEFILREDESKDTVSNLYYLKKLIFKPKKIKEILFIVADFRIERIRYFCKRILGSEYKVHFLSVNSESGEIYPNEAHTFKIYKEFLSPMKSGDDAWLDGKFFTAPIYSYWKNLLLKKSPKDRLFS